MKVQTAVLLLCFLSGVFLSVVQAKPSPALMSELVALEKYLENKEGSEGADGQNENPGEKPTGEESPNWVESLLNQDKAQNEPHNIGKVEENQKIETAQDKPKNENNNGAAETNTAEGLSSTGENKKPSGQEDGVPPENMEENSGPSGTEEETLDKEEGSTDSGGKGKGENLQEGNRPGSSEGQVEEGRDQIFKVLDGVQIKMKDALDELITLDEKIRKQFQDQDHIVQELKDEGEQKKEKAKQILGHLKTFEADIKSAFGLDETSSDGKKSVRENAPARRSFISNTEFFNILHSLLTNN